MVAHLRENKEASQPLKLQQSSPETVFRIYVSLSHSTSNFAVLFCFSPPPQLCEIY